MQSAGEKRRLRAPKKQEIAKMDKSPPSLKKQMTDEQLARFLQEQEEILSNRDENIVPRNMQTNLSNNDLSNMTKDEQFAWKLQMEEQYYQELLFQRESDSPAVEETLEYDYDSDELLAHEPNEEREAHPLVLNFDDSESDSEDNYGYTESDEEHEQEEQPQIFETYEELLNLTEIVPVVSRGVKEQDLENLASFVITSEQVSLYENCNVCLEDFESGEECRTLLCKHAYHKNCIDQWLTINKICPVCRFEIK